MTMLNSVLGRDNDWCGHLWNITEVQAYYFCIITCRLPLQEAALTLTHEALFTIIYGSR